MTDKSVWDKENTVPLSVVSFVDKAVEAALPKGTTVLGITPHGASYWTRGAEVETEDAEGNSISYFMKVCQGETGKGMVYGEFESISALYDAIVGITPKPIAWGTFDSDPEMHFFLCSFHDMTNDIPKVSNFPALIAKLHQKTSTVDGKFGFHVATYEGTFRQDTRWCDTWEEYFLQSMASVFESEKAAQGPDPELFELETAWMEKVIPRLLRPMETEGRRVIPCLVHGDLWDGNASVDVATNRPIIFDAGCSYAHNEYELAAWRQPRHKIGKPYINEYLKHFPMAEPTEDFDDRNALYCIRFDLMSSSLYPGNLRFRNVAKEQMRLLVDKHSKGFEGYSARKNKALYDTGSSSSVPMEDESHTRCSPDE